MAEVCPKTTPKLLNGIARLPSGDMTRLNTCLALYTTKATACPETTLKQLSGYVWRPNKATPTLNISLALCTGEAAACPKTTYMLTCGLTWPLHVLVQINRKPIDRRERR